MLNAYTNTLMNSRIYSFLLKIRSRGTTFFSLENDWLTNKIDPPPTLTQRLVFILFTKDEQVDPLVVDFY